MPTLKKRERKTNESYFITIHPKTVEDTSISFNKKSFVFRPAQPQSKCLSKPQTLGKLRKRQKLEYMGSLLIFRGLITGYIFKNVFLYISVSMYTEIKSISYAKKFKRNY